MRVSRAGARAARPFITPELCRRLMEDARTRSIPCLSFPVPTSRGSLGKDDLLDRTEYSDTDASGLEKAPYQGIHYTTPTGRSRRSMIASGREISRTEGLESILDNHAVRLGEALSMTGASKIQKDGTRLRHHSTSRPEVILAGIEIEEPGTRTSGPFGCG
jgi:hypothetical protein